MSLFSKENKLKKSQYRLLQENVISNVYEQNILHLIKEDIQIFIKALGLPKPNKRLLSAMKRYKKEVHSNPYQKLERYYDSNHFTAR